MYVVGGTSAGAREQPRYAFVCACMCAGTDGAPYRFAQDLCCTQAGKPENEINDDIFQV